MNLPEELEKLQNLRKENTISEEEFIRAKKVLLAKHEKATGSRNTSISIKEWCMFIHLSQFCGYLIPLAGFIVPIILWQIKKDESILYDVHGKVVTNWILSELIYIIVSSILIVIIIGIPLLIAIGVVSVIFPIIGGIKANNNEVWRYPLSIDFFKYDQPILQK